MIIKWNWSLNESNCSESKSLVSTVSVVTDASQPLRPKPALLRKDYGEWSMWSIMQWHHPTIYMMSVISSYFMISSYSESVVVTCFYVRDTLCNTDKNISRHRTGSHPPRWLKKETKKEHLREECPDEVFYKLPRLTNKLKGCCNIPKVPFQEEYLQTYLNL